MLQDDCLETVVVTHYSIVLDCHRLVTVELYTTSHFTETAAFRELTVIAM